MKQSVEKVATVILVLASLLLSSCGTTHKADTEKVFARQSHLTTEQQKTLDRMFLDAVCLQQGGHDTEAYELLQMCLEMDSLAPQVNYRMMEYTQKMRNDSMTMMYLRRAVDNDPTNKEYLLLQALSYTYFKQYDKAIESYKRLLKLSPNDSETWEMLLRLYVQQNDITNAIAALNQLEVIEGNSEKITMTKVELLTRQGKKDEARAEIETLVKKYPHDTSYRISYADWKMSNGIVDEGYQDICDIIEKEPDNVDARLSQISYHISRGNDSLVFEGIRTLLCNVNTETKTKGELIRHAVKRNQELGGDSTQIISLFEDVLSHKQQDATLHMFYAAYMEMLEMPKEHIDSVYTEALVIEPDNLQARIRLVASEWDKQDWQQVVKLCRQGQQYSPDEPVFYYYGAMALNLADEIDDALVMLQHARDVMVVEENPDLCASVYSLMAELYHQKGQSEDAYAAYDSCLQIKPDDLMSLNNYAYYLAEEGRELEKAEQMSYKTIQAEPENANSLDTYAWILYKQGRYEEALIYIDQALQHADPEGNNITLESHKADIKTALELIELNKKEKKNRNKKK